MRSDFKMCNADLRLVSRELEKLFASKVGYLELLP